VPEDGEPIPAFLLSLQIPKTEIPPRTLVPPDMPPPSPDILIREATPADLPALCRLLAVLFEQEADFQPDADRQARGLALILGRPDVGRILCADDGAGVVGMVSLLYTVSTAEGGRAAWLEDMVMHPAPRGGGIGKRLLSGAVAQARADGCVRITLLTDATNAGAQRFYGRVGFVRSGMIPMRLGLDNQVRPGG
jgi:GNAT superfamily N-acetyltransferase